MMVDTEIRSYPRWRAASREQLLVRFAAAFAVGIVGCGGDDLPPPPPLPTLSDGQMDGTEAGSGAPGSGGEDESSPSIETCDDGLNPRSVDAPAVDFEQYGFRFDIAADGPRGVLGTVISTAGVGEPRVIDQAILVGTGSFLEDGCLVNHGGTSVSWEGVACQAEEGTLFNVLVVEPKELERFSLMVERGTTIRLSGYEIDRINDYSPGGGYWEDGGSNASNGQVSLWLTDICEMD